MNYMNKNHRVKFFAASLILSSALLVISAGCSRQGSNAAVTPTSSGPFKMIADEIKFKKLPPQQGEPRVQLTVYVRHEGAEPTWWKQKDEWTPSEWIQNMRFVDQKGKEYSLYSFGGGTAPYDESKQAHVLQYTCVVPNGYDITKPGHFKGSVVIARELSPLKPLAVARFSVPVRLE
jgi:hypothetical protein